MDAVVALFETPHLVGRAEVMFFSIDASARWYAPWTWPGAIRFATSRPTSLRPPRRSTAPSGILSALTGPD